MLLVKAKNIDLLKVTKTHLKDVDFYNFYKKTDDVSSWIFNNRSLKNKADFCSERIF